MLYLNKPVITTPGQGVDILLQAEKDVAAIEEQLSQAKAYKRELEVQILPDIFGNAEQKRAESTSGAAALMGLHIEGSLPKVDEKAPEADQALARQARDAAIALAESYEWGPFIKSTVTAAYDKGDRQKAVDLFNNLRRMDNSVVLKIDEGIHAATLASQAKKRILEGKSLDSATLGLTILTAVKLTKRPRN